MEASLQRRPGGRPCQHPQRLRHPTPTSLEVWPPPRTAGRAGSSLPAPCAPCAPSPTSSRTWSPAPAPRAWGSIETPAPAPSCPARRGCAALSSSRGFPAADGARTRGSDRQAAPAKLSRQAPSTRSHPYLKSSATPTVRPQGRQIAPGSIGGAAVGREVSPLEQTACRRAQQAPSRSRPPRLLPQDLQGPKPAHRDPTRPLAWVRGPSQTPRIPPGPPARRCNVATAAIAAVLRLPREAGGRGRSGWPWFLAPRATVGPRCRAPPCSPRVPVRRARRENAGLVRFPAAPARTGRGDPAGLRCRGVPGSRGGAEGGGARCRPPSPGHFIADLAQARAASLVPRPLARVPSPWATSALDPGHHSSILRVIRSAATGVSGISVTAARRRLGASYRRPGAGAVLGARPHGDISTMRTQIPWRIDERPARRARGAVSQGEGS